MGGAARYADLCADRLEVPVACCDGMDNREAAYQRLSAGGAFGWALGVRMVRRLRDMKDEPL